MSGPDDADSRKPSLREVKQAAGRKGGQSTFAKYGSSHFEDIGDAGGNVTLARYGVDWFRTLGRRSAESRRLAKEMQP